MKRNCFYFMPEKFAVTYLYPRKGLTKPFSCTNTAEIFTVFRAVTGASTYKLKHLNVGIFSIVYLHLHLLSNDCRLAQPLFIRGSYACENVMVLIFKYHIDGSMFNTICMPSFGNDENCTV